MAGPFDTLWARINVATINAHLKKVPDATMRMYYLLSALREKGRIEYNQSGKKCDWRVVYKQLTSVPIEGDMDTRRPKRSNIYRDMSLPWRGRQMTEAFSKFEQLANAGGPTQLINVISDVSGRMRDDLTDDLSADLYNDGNASGYEDRLHGLESWFSTSGAHSDGKIGSPNDSYGGLTLTLGNYGGSWTGTYPYPGTGGTEYEFVSPLVVDVTDTAWLSSTKTWAANWREQVQFAQMVLSLRKVKPDVILCSPDFYQDAVNSLESKERVVIERSREGSLAAKLGWNALNMLGMDMVTEYPIGTSRAYMLSFKNLTLRSMQPQLFVMEKENDFISATKRLNLDFYGQLFIDTPRNSAKFVSIT